MASIHELFSNSIHLNNYSTETFKSHLNTRFGSIGRSKRFDYCTDKISPGPGMYSPIIKESIKTVKFGSSNRGAYADNIENPGPGHYKLPKYKGISYTIAKRLEPKLPKVPGPGEYELKTSGSHSRKAIFGTEVRRDNFLNPALSRNPEP